MSATAKQNDFLIKNMIIVLLTFLLVEALLPDEFKTVRLFYMVTQLLVLFFLNVENEGEVTVTSSSHVLMAFGAFTIAYMEISPITPLC